MFGNPTKRCLGRRPGHLDHMKHGLFNNGKATGPGVPHFCSKPLTPADPVEVGRKVRVMDHDPERARRILHISGLGAFGAVASGAVRWESGIGFAAFTAFIVTTGAMLPLMGPSRVIWVNEVGVMS